ncbi:hypothetical protein G4B88_028655 [Cannabis sativa]|uniref:CCHC-type domain-containing protein n=1 Tax=Cannabis sativa TaxID=3483 RepID=A0A7J6DP25_CANSA|nr:hypothetical protein G4B88_028655 [Cannabis sativa]
MKPSLEAIPWFCTETKVVAPMLVEADAIIEFVTKLWQKKVSVFSISNVPGSQNCFKIGFECVEDRDWALHNAPWLFRGYTFALHAWGPGIESSNSVNVVRLWVQFHNLPQEYFSIENGNLLGRRIGDVIQIELDEEKPATWGDKRWIQFKYEKIGIFCYQCGRLGHQRKGCSFSSPVTVAAVDGSVHPLFGPWLSTASRFHDVFSGGTAQAVLPPRGGPSSAPANGGKAVRQLASAARVSKKWRKGIGREVMVSSQGGEQIWVPKLTAGGRSPRITRNGNRVEMNLNGREKLSVDFPSVREAPFSGIGGDTELLCSDKAPVQYTNLRIEEEDRSKEGLNISNDITVGVNRLGSGPNSVGLKVNLMDGLLEKKKGDVALINVQGRELCSGPGKGGPALSVTGQGTSSNTIGGPNRSVFNHSSIGPQLVIGKEPLLLEGNRGSPRLARGKSSPSGPLQIDRKRDGQPGQPLNLLPSTPPEDACVAIMQSDEENALSQFFQAQEDLLHDLKHFGKLDLYEIRKIGGDIGVPTSSDVNERTTPFKKRKFEASASLCSRPHKIHRKYPGVIRDFPWDSKQHDNESKVVSEEPSENSSSSLNGRDIAWQRMQAVSQKVCMVTYVNDNCWKLSMSIQRHALGLKTSVGGQMRGIQVEGLDG